MELGAVAAEVLGRALRAGATDAEAVAYEGDEFSVKVRLGQVDTLEESGSRAVGVRVLFGLRSASASTSDLSREGLDQLVNGAVSLAKITGEDLFAGLPEPAAFGALDGDLRIYFKDVLEQPPAERIELARRCEAAALAFDPRIQNSGGGDFNASASRKVMRNSRGFAGEYRRSYCGFSASPIAVDADGKMQRNYWSTSARTTGLLDDPEAVGKKAAERSLRRLGARRVRTQQVPVVFAPEIARGLIGNLFEAANGDAVYRHATFLDGMLGQRIGGENLTVVDDGTMVFDRGGVRVGGFGTSPFDGEGLPTRRTVLVERGVLKSYVLNSYLGRKLGMASTGNASRGLAGAPGVGAGNFYLEAGAETPEQIVGRVKTGLYVTETMGFGVNLVTGDYSQGAAGLWIENGELAYAVEEITIAGNLKEMYRNISGIGDDLVFRGSSAAPTLMVEGMTVAGA